MVWINICLVGSIFELNRCPGQTYEFAFETGDLGIVDFWKHLLLLRKYALYIFCGVMIQTLDWPARSAGE